MRSRIPFRLALVGFALTIALFADAELSDYASFGPTLRIISDVLCPALVAGSYFYLFMDLNKHSGPMAVAWVFMGLLDGAIYYGVGALLALISRKSRSPAVPHQD